MPSRFLPRARVRLFGRYAAASLVAVACSELAFLLSYWLGALPAVASVIAWLAGAVPNYLINRHWAWRERARADRRKEILPYVTIVLLTAGAAAGVTTLADAWVQGRIDSHNWRVLLVGLAYIGTYGVMFLLKFALFDRFVFTGVRDENAANPAADTPETRYQA